MPDRTVGEIVAENPSQARVFQAFGIDFCCQGGRTLQEACTLKGLAVETVIEQLEASIEKNMETRENPALLSPVELIQHIVETHHTYLRSELPRIQAMAERVAKVHGGHTPSLVEVYRIHCCMAEELASHMMKEEEILFPAIKKLCAGESNGLSLDGPVACMLQEHEAQRRRLGRELHEDAGAAMAELRELTHGFTPPSEACNTYRALFAGLAELEEDLHRHIHLENSVLFPKALALWNAN